MKRFLTLALLLSSAQISFAQPATDNAPKAANPSNTDTAAALRQATELAQKFMKMTPEQRREMMRVRQEQALRANLIQAGFADVKLQDTVVAFVADQEKSRQKVRAAATQLNFALMKPAAAPDVATDAAALTALTENYLNMADDVKIEREAATKALDKAIGFSTQPRLMAFLLLKGIIGDASSFTGEVLLSGMMSMSAALTIRQN